MSSDILNPRKPSPVRAFPRPGTGDGGMTLRDYFAAKAMQSNIVILEDWPGGERAADVAKYAYAMADAMLAEREKP